MDLQYCIWAIENKDVLNPYEKKAIADYLRDMQILEEIVERFEREE